MKVGDLIGFAFCGYGPASEAYRRRANSRAGHREVERTVGEWTGAGGDAMWRRRDGPFAVEVRALQKGLPELTLFVFVRRCYRARLQSLVEAFFQTAQTVLDAAEPTITLSPSFPRRLWRTRSCPRSLNRSLSPNANVIQLTGLSNQGFSTSWHPSVCWLPPCSGSARSIVYHYGHDDYDRKITLPMRLKYVVTSMSPA